MEKITINELIDFRKKSDKSKKLLAFKLKNRKPKEKPKKENDAGGGDYWKTSTSCINNVFKSNNEMLYDFKINELYTKLKASLFKNAKTMYQKNIDILNSFKDFKFDEIKPAETIKFLKILKDYKIILIDSFPVYVNPNIVYSFEKNGKSELGALWLVPKVKGYKKIELGMFCEMLYKFLIKNYADTYQISFDHCVVIDTVNVQKVQYQNFLNGNIPFLIDDTLKEINSL